MWFSHNDQRNLSIRTSGKYHTNQIEELIATVVAIQVVSTFISLKIITDSLYVIQGLTTHLLLWENIRWISIKNALLFKRAAYLLKKCTATTHFRWINGHSGDQGNKGSDTLAKKGTRKPQQDEIDLSILTEFNIQGAKLSATLQAIAYRGIMECNPKQEQKAAKENLKKTQDALELFSSTNETDEKIWQSLRKKEIRTQVKQFLYKTMHHAYMVGPA